jgi:hypothetical protein
MPLAVDRLRLNSSQNNVFVTSNMEVLLFSLGEGVGALDHHIAEAGVASAHVLLVTTEIRQEPLAFINSNNIVAAAFAAVGRARDIQVRQFVSPLLL